MTARGQRQTPSTPRGTSRGASVGGHAVEAAVEVRVDHVEFDPFDFVAALAPLVVGAIVRRVGRGLDVNGAAFRPYSARHVAVRVERGLGAAPVDLRMTGGLLGSVGVRSVTRTSDGGIVLAIGPDATVSRGANVPHNIVGRYLTERGRDWLGLTPGQVADIEAELAAAGWPVRITRG